MNVLARRRGFSLVWRSLRPSAVDILFLSILWIGGHSSAQAQTVTGAPPQVRPERQEPDEPKIEPDPPAVVEATKALNEGAYDRVDALARDDETGAPKLAALHGRALAARGKYDEALAALTAASGTTPGSEATLELGLLQQRLGRRAEASQAFMLVLKTYSQDPQPADLLRIARAARALGQSRQASGLYQRVTTLLPDDPAVQTGWGELFLEKYNTGEAIDAFRAALKTDGRWVDALIGLARAQVDQGAERARETVQQALAINEHSVEAHLILADLALDDRKLDEAAKEIAAAQAVNPASLEALAMQASIAHLQGKPAEFEALVAKALAINPRYADAYRIPGVQTASHYRFDEAVVLLKKGIEIDPESARAHADLGVQLLRTGDETTARAELERAFKLDGYDVVTYNLLSMLDTLEKFETIEHGNLIVRLHPDDAKVMREPLLGLTQEALASLSKSYGFTPQGPILIEAFSKHDDFAVRTLGLPGMIGALGACFGRVVTLDSPRARPPGSFNWGATLWHELAHVMTLQMSKQRVPRWLTEGVSVFEERRARPEWGREGEFDFLNAMAQGELIKVADLNSAFSSSRTIGLAYHESSLLAEHLVETYGDAGLHRMLQAYGEGLDNEAVFQRALNTNTAGIQQSFDQFLEKRFGKIRTALQPIDAEPPGKEAEAPAIRAFADRYDQNYPVQLMAGRVLFDKGDLEGAQAVLERATALVPQTMGDASARVGLAEVAAKRGDNARAMRELTTLLAESHTGLEAAQKLAVLAREASDEPTERKAIERMVALDPFDPTVYAGLGRLALAQQDAPAATRALQTALELGAQDPAAVHTDLAEAYLIAGDQAQVRQHAIAALEIAPRFERAQELLLKVVDARRP